MALNNPQSNFEDSIFGSNGTHPAPKTLPYPTQPISTLYGDMVEYLIPEGQKERVLKKLYPDFPRSRTKRLDFLGNGL